MARISVFGIGYVGAVAAACLARDGHDITAVDLDQSRVALINRGQSPIVETGLSELISEGVEAGRLRATSDVGTAIDQSDISLICVGTPSAKSGALDLTQVKTVCRQVGDAIARKTSYHSVILRSTILPGTCDNICRPILESSAGKIAGQGFGLGYFPEFLREGTAIEDYDDPGIIVFGALDQRTADILKALNVRQACCLHEVSLRTAEMIKYTSNSWRATKVTFANEIGNISKACGIDGHEVMDVLCADHKVSMSPKFLRPGFAFGGSCLPKDIRALRHLGKSVQAPTPLLSAVLKANEAQITRAEHMIMRANVGKVGFVGVSFKPGTDDLRESPLAELAARLIKRGQDVRVFDPFVQQSLSSEPLVSRGQTILPDLAARITPTLQDLIDGADAIVVGNYYQDTVEALGKAAVTKPMVDLTRLRRDLVSKGSYEGICW